MKNVFVFLFAVFIFWPCSSFVFAINGVDINTASLGDLDKIIGIGPVLAQRIADARPFVSVDDLLRVKGIGEKTLQKIKEQGLAYVENRNETPAIAESPPIKESAPKTSPQDTSAETILAPIYPAGIFINELLPSPDGADESNEWIELFNSNNFSADLSGWKIRDEEGTIMEYGFPPGAQIASEGYLIIKRTETKITLNNEGDEITLFFPGGKIADAVVFQSARKGYSYNKIGEDWQWSASPTPGAPNTIPAESPASLPKQNKSDNEKTSGALAAVSESANKKLLSPSDIVNKEWRSPIVLFLFALSAAIISAIIILVVKIKFKK